MTIQSSLAPTFGLLIGVSAALLGISESPSSAMPIARGAFAFTMAIEQAKPPNGWEAFCARYRSECKAETDHVQRLAEKSNNNDPVVQEQKSISLVDDWFLDTYWIWTNESYFKQSEFPKINYAALNLFPLAHEKILNDAGWMLPNQSTESKLSAVEIQDEKPTKPHKIELTSDAWDKIVEINRLVNSQIKGVPDRKHYGTINKWVYPDDGKGDCKAYTLVKRRKLMDAGFPREALLITIVWTKQNLGHAVLTVRTDKGDYILDNLTPHVLFWKQTTHDFVKRQSVSDPNKWVYIDGPRGATSSMASD